MRKFALLGALLTLVFACGSLHLRGPACAPPAQEHLDLLLAGGQVVDGSGSPARAEDVGIRGDRIAFLGNAPEEKVAAERILDVRGLTVCPGFIDPHTHTSGDLSSPKRNGNVSYLMQGVTTVVVGNDGGGSPQVAKTLDLWRRQGIGTNALLLVRSSPHSGRGNRG